MSLLRVVFDTSTLVSAALRPGSIPFQALDRALRMHDLCASRDTLDELQTVLSRDKFRRYLPRELGEQFVRLSESHARLLAIRDTDWIAGHPRCRDPHDDKFLRLAWECEAEAIISSDDDLLVLDPWAGIRILRPLDYLNVR